MKMYPDDNDLVRQAVTAFAVWMLLIPLLWWVAPKWLVYLACVLAGMSLAIAVCIALLAASDYAEDQRQKRAET